MNSQEKVTERDLLEALELVELKRKLPGVTDEELNRIIVNELNQYLPTSITSLCKYPNCDNCYFTGQKFACIIWCFNNPQIKDTEAETVINCKKQI